MFFSATYFFLVVISIFSHSFLCSSFSFSIKTKRLLDEVRLSVWKVSESVQHETMVAFGWKIVTLKSYLNYFDSFVCVVVQQSWQLLFPLLSGVFAFSFCVFIVTDVDKFVLLLEMNSMIRNTIGFHPHCPTKDLQNRMPNLALELRMNRHHNIA